MTHCTDEPLYTGISIDVEKPYAQYALQKGGEYFRDQKSKQLVYLEKGRGRSSASTRESAIKNYYALIKFC